MRLSRRPKLWNGSGRARVQTHAKKSAIGRLSALREALQDSVPDEHWQAAEAQELPLKLAGLQERWEQKELSAAAKPKRERGSTGRPGVRRVQGAIEYDFSQMRDEDIDDGSDDDTPDLHRPSVASEVRYFDSAAINVRAGHGGNGCCAFLREKFTPHGGPCGGNGGHGGSVWAIADENMHSLTPFRGRVHWKADNGGNGGGKSKHGANAGDLFIKLPVGTIVRKKEDIDEDLQDSQPPIAELVKHGDKALVLQGGRGGRGNEAFKTGKNNAPTIAEDGEQGLEQWLTLELKLMADVGIIGVPNSGKSTLLSVLSNAKPKIANYAFTTLVPNLGVCELDFETTVFADVPGLIEGAHNGTGLGVEFLRHVSRAHTLVHVLDGTARDPLYDYRAIRLELQLFGGGLAGKPQIVAYNKVDVPDSGDYVDDMKALLWEECGVPPESVVPISAVTGEGVLELVRKVRGVLGALPQQPPRLSTNAINQQVKAQKPGYAEEIGDYDIEAQLDAERVWYVSGPALERFAQMTNFSYWEATLRFQRVLEAVGLWNDLERRGVREGDTVVIGATEFLWRDDRSEARMYEGWQKTQGGAGPGKGSKRWPHMTV